MPLRFTVTLGPGWWANLTLRIGIWVLALGVLVYLAARSTGGGVAGLILSSLLWWGVFEFAVLPVRAAWSEGQRLSTRHATLGGCLTLFAVCGGGGIFLMFGPTLILGLLIGPLVAVLSRREDVIALVRSTGLGAVLPPAPGSASPPFQLPAPRWALAVVGLVAMLAGLTFMALGTFRSLEVYGTLSDFCLHPCGMVHGAWVDVLPGSDGAVLSRLDANAVRLQVRFHDDVAEARTVGRDDLTLEFPPTVYPPLTGRPECPAWAPQTLHIDQATADLALCFAVPQAGTIDPQKLVLNFRQDGDWVQVSLGMGPGTIEIGGSPSPFVSSTTAA